MMCFVILKAGWTVVQTLLNEPRTFVVHSENKSNGISYMTLMESVECNSHYCSILNRGTCNCNQLHFQRNFPDTDQTNRSVRVDGLSRCIFRSSGCSAMIWNEFSFSLNVVNKCEPAVCYRVWYIYRCSAHSEKLDQSLDGMDVHWFPN